MTLSPMHQLPVGISVLYLCNSAEDQSIEFLLSQCHYQVKSTVHAPIALDLLHDSKSTFDLVIIDMDVHGMDGLKLLTDVVLSMDIPVIALSSNSIIELLMEGYKYGVCELLHKPVRIEELQNIWRHVEIRRRNKLNPKHNNLDWTRAVSLEGRNEFKESEQQNNNNTLQTQRKRRVVWSDELKCKFKAAVNKLGIDQAVPKRILELMDDENLTRENVASHLQKYRLSLKKSNNNPKKAPLFGDVHPACNMQPFSRVSFGDVDSTYDNTTIGGVEDTHSMASSGYVSHSTASYVSESPEFIDGQQLETHTNINDTCSSCLESECDHDLKQAKWPGSNIEHEHNEDNTLVGEGYLAHYFPGMALNVHVNFPQIMQGQPGSIDSAAVLSNSATLAPLPSGFSSDMGDVGGYQGGCTPPPPIISGENSYPGGQYFYHSDMGNLTSDCSDYNLNIFNTHTLETYHELYRQAPGSASSFAFSASQSFDLKPELNYSPADYVELRDHLRFQEQIQSTHQTMDPQTTQPTQEPHGHKAG